MTRVGSVVVAAGLLAGAAGSASAHEHSKKDHPKKEHSEHAGKANTKMRFHLQDHEVAAGDTVTGPVHMATKDGRQWAPFAGASLSVRVDGTEVGTLTTDDNGDATVSFVADADGEHVVKVVYAGDDSHRMRMRAQGLTVGTSDETADDPDGTDDGSGDTGDTGDTTDTGDTGDSGTATSG